MRKDIEEVIEIKLSKAKRFEAARLSASDFEDKIHLSTLQTRLEAVAKSMREVLDREDEKLFKLRKFCEQRRKEQGAAQEDSLFNWCIAKIEEGWSSDRIRGFAEGRLGSGSELSEILARLF